MVMFKEDEERIKKMEREEKEANRSRFGRILRRIVKFLIFISIFLFVGLSTLTMMGGNSDALKGGLEKYLSLSTNMEAEIGELEHLKFFPNLSVSAKDIKIIEPESEAIQISADSASFAVGFFDIMFSQRKFSDLSFENLNIKKSYNGIADLVVTSVKIEEGEKGPFLKAEGRFGEEALKAQMSLEKDGPKYAFPKQSMLELSLGDANLQAVSKRHFWDGLNLEVTKFKLGADEAAGHIHINGNKLKGSVKAARSEIEFDLNVKNKLIAGNLSSKSLHIDDYPVVDNFIERMRLYLPAADGAKESQIRFYDIDLDIHTKLDSIFYKGADLGSLVLPIKVKNENLTIKPLNGVINGGDVSGEITLAAQSLPAELSIDIKVDDWNYGDFQTKVNGDAAIDGKGDVIIELNAAANTYNALWSNLNGKIGLISTQGEIKIPATNYWGTGLVNSLVPDFSKDDESKMNCMIASFEVENSVAKTSPLFVDTQSMTLRGEGTINLVSQGLDLNLYPESKNTELLDVSPSVDIDGTLSDPRIRPNTASLLGKIGGLALGAINPALLAISLTDLGITENHPCREFIDEDLSSD